MLRWVEKQHNLEELQAAYAFCAHLALLQDEVEQASQWCDLAGEQEVLCPMRFLEDPPITKAYVLLSQDKAESLLQGQALLNDLIQNAEAIHNARKASW